MSYTLIHNTQEFRYEYHIDVYIAYITYDDQNGNMHLTQTIVPEELAKCSYITKYLKKFLSKQSVYLKVVGEGFLL